jgi:hypothetical protein
MKHKLIYPPKGRRVQIRRENAPQTLAALNGAILALMDWLNVKNVAKQMRHFCAQPQEVLQLLLGKLSR